MQESNAKTVAVVTVKIILKQKNRETKPSRLWDKESLQHFQSWANIKVVDAQRANVRRATANAIWMDSYVESIANVEIARIATIQERLQKSALDNLKSDIL